MRVFIFYGLRLQVLLDSSYEVCAVYTQPDKPKGEDVCRAPPVEGWLSYWVGVSAQSCFEQGMRFHPIWPGTGTGRHGIVGTY